MELRKQLVVRAGLDWNSVVLVMGGCAEKVGQGLVVMSAGGEAVDVDGCCMPRE